MSYSSQTRKLVIAGLGNYTHPLTKHSIGQLLVENLAKKASSIPNSIGNSNLILNKKTSIFSTKILIPSTNSIILPTINSQGLTLSPLEIYFIKSSQFMNLSGSSLISASKLYLNSKELNSGYRLISLSDDLDLSSLTFKLQKGGSSRGHNGLRSIEKYLNHKSFYRIRLGIGRSLKGEVVSDWVMSPLTRDEVKSVELGGQVLEGVWKLLMDVGWRDEGV